MTNWWNADPIIEDRGGVLVVRDDLLPGGSKSRFLPVIAGDAKEVVYGGPFCGGAAYAISVWAARESRKATLFYAKRNTLHWRQREAFRLGATIYQVPAGRINVVQARARAYAADHGALMLPLGFDVPAASDPFIAVMRGVRDRVGTIDEVWCCCGSGMLTRCLGTAFPDASVIGVMVGLKSRSRLQAMPGNVRLIDSGYEFSEECRQPSPFDSCGNYDRKAWALCAEAARTDPDRRRLFWNVGGNGPQVT